MSAYHRNLCIHKEVNETTSEQLKVVYKYVKPFQGGLDEHKAVTFQWVPILVDAICSFEFSV